MYSKKSVGPRMDLWGTPALTRCCCEDFPSRTTWSWLLLKIEEIRANVWLENQWDLRLWRSPACQTLSKALDMSSATDGAAPDLLKALAILSNTTVKRSQSIVNIIEKTAFFSVINNAIIYKFFKDLTVRKKTNWAVVFSCRLFPQHSSIQAPPSKNLENETTSDSYWRVQLVYMKVQAHSSLKPPM